MQSDSEGEALGFLLVSTEAPSAYAAQGRQYRRLPTNRPFGSPANPSADTTAAAAADSQLKDHGRRSRWSLRHLSPQQLISLLSSWLAGSSRQPQHHQLLLPRAAAAQGGSSPLSFPSMTTSSAAAAAEAGGPVLTVRALVAGLLVGAVLCFSNTYFGLQTGWVTMGSLQSAILGYGLFQGLSAAGLLTRHLNAAENVIVQTTAVATATMPLAAGLVGIIPALGLLTPDERPGGPVTFSPAQLLAWCSALAFFGVFVAVPLRHQTIIREKLRFPSGTATASVIRTLHGLPPLNSLDDEPPDGSSSSGSGGSNTGPPPAATGGSRWGTKQRQSDERGCLLAADAAAGVHVRGEAWSGASDASSGRDHTVSGLPAGSNGGSNGISSSSGGGGGANTALQQVDLEVAVWGAECEQEHVTLLGGLAAAAGSSSSTLQQQQQQQQWGRALRLLLWSFALSGAYSLAAAWVKPLRVLKVFDWLGLPAATAWGWVLQPSAGYIGQGMIMGPKTAWSMMAGAVTGWAVLGPLAKAKGWAPGPIKDVETGAAGWLMWFGLAILLGDCFSELALLLGNTAYEKAVAAGAAGQPGGSSGGGWFGRVRERAKSPFGWGGGGVDSGDGGGYGNGQLRPGSGGSVYSSHLQQQLQQQGSGLRSRVGSKSGIAGSTLELSPNSSSGDVVNAAGDGAASRSFLEQQQQQEGGGVGAATGAVVLSVGSEAEGAQPLLSHHPQQQQQTHSQQRGPAGVAAAAAASAAAVYAADADADRAADSHAWLLSGGFWVPGLLLSTGLATAVLSPMLGMPFYEPLVAVLVALLVALLAVRALGQTDLNPVSGVGKVSQLVFAVVSPGAVLPNLVAGAIAEAGAQQAGDLMQDFKTAHLLGVAPSSQLVAMLLGSAASVPLSVAAYLLYTHAWQVPGPELPAPTAQIWLDMAKLVNGGHLPEHIGPFCAGAAAVAAALPLLQLLLKRLQQQQQLQSQPPNTPAGRPASGSVLRQAAGRLWGTWSRRTAVDWCLALLPSGVGFAVGCYLTPNWTVPRLLGSVFEQVWLLAAPESHAAFMMVTASGLVLGEGCASVVTAVLQATARKST